MGLLSELNEDTVPKGKSALEEPNTHFLIELPGGSAPLPVDKAVVLRNQSFHPNDTDRDGEIQTRPLDPATTLIINP
jgi:hypothetical protein